MNDLQFGSIRVTVPNQQEVYVTFPKRLAPEEATAARLEELMLRSMSSVGASTEWVARLLIVSFPDHNGQQAALRALEEAVSFCPKVEDGNGTRTYYVSVVPEGIDLDTRRVGNLPPGQRMVRSVPYNRLLQKLSTLNGVDRLKATPGSASCVTIMGGPEWEVADAEVLVYLNALAVGH